MAKNETRTPDIATSISEDGQTLTFTFAGGLSPLVIARADVPEKVAQYATMHGLKQRLSDVAALGQYFTNGPRKGEKVHLTDKVDAICELWGHMQSKGEWFKTDRSGVGGDGGLLVAAMVRITGASLADVQALVDTYDAKTQAHLRDVDPDVSPVVAEIRRERAKTSATPIPDWRAALGQS